MIVKDLLEKEKFQYLRVLNQNADLNRTISTVESTESPDVSAYISRNTLLVMTGMAFQDDPLLMCGFLEELDKRECAGVAIKLGRFLDYLDDCVLETADRLGIPLLQIPMDVTLGKVYHEILSYIWNNQNDQLLNALNAQQKITTLILHGSSLKSIINNMTAILGTPVMIVDMWGKVQDYGYSYSQADREKTLCHVETLLKEDRLESDEAYTCEEQEICCCIYPIKGLGRNTNYLVIKDFDPGKAEDQMLVMEQVIMALEIYFYRDLYMKYNQIKSREEFLTILLEQIDERSWDERQVLAIGKGHGIRSMPEYRAVLLELDKEERQPFQPNRFSSREEYFILAYEWIQEFLEEKEDRSILIFPEESQFRYVLLIQGEQEGMEDIYEKICRYLRDRFKKEIRIAQGGIFSDILKIRGSYREAQSSLCDGQPNEKYPYLYSYRPKNFKELFKFIPEREKEEMCTYMLKELAFPENLMQEELRKTLYTYLFCGKNIAQTAETLSLHRNTIKYRVKKCEDILGVQLSDDMDSFRIQLALVLAEEAKETEERMERNQS